MASQCYYIPVGEEQKADWEDYRRRYIDHAKALAEVAKEIGAVKFCRGFGGSLVGAMFGENPVHAAFSHRSNRIGAHPVLSRGRSAAQKAAIDWMEGQNAKLRNLFPSPFPVAKKHGFIAQVDYSEIKEPGEKGSPITGSFALGAGFGFEPVHAVWFGYGSPIVLLTEDVDARIQAQKVCSYSGKRYTVTPDSFATPDGYERISEAKYNFMKADFELKREESKNE